MVDSRAQEADCNLMKDTLLSCANDISIVPKIDDCPTLLSPSNNDLNVKMKRDDLQEMACEGRQDPSFGDDFTGAALSSPE